MKELWPPKGLAFQYLLQRRLKQIYFRKGIERRSLPRCQCQEPHKRRTGSPSRSLHLAPKQAHSPCIQRKKELLKASSVGLQGSGNCCLSIIKGERYCGDHVSVIPLLLRIVWRGEGADSLFTHRPPGRGEAHPSLIYRTAGHLEILL